MVLKRSILLVVVLIVLSACLGLEPTATPEPVQEPEDEIFVIAWIPKALNNPVFELGRAGAEARARALTAGNPYGYEVEVRYMAPVTSDAITQAQLVREAVENGVDAIGISCNDPIVCIAPINEAVAAGVPVMTWDSDSPESDRFTYLGVDNRAGGQAAAELLMAALPEGGQVAVLSGIPGAFNLEMRILGFEEVLRDSNVEIVETVYCDDDVDLGVEIVESVMVDHPELDGWFFVGLWPLIAGADSMPRWKAAASSGEIVTVAFDTLPMELEMVEEGLIYGLVGQKYWDWGSETVQILFDYTLNDKEFDSFTDTGMDLVTQKNVDAMIEAWETRDFTQPLPPHE